jgi:hypothetical protein
VQRNGPLHCRLPTIEEQIKGGEEVQEEEQGLQEISRSCLCYVTP